MLSVIFQKLLYRTQGRMQPWGRCAALGFFLIMGPVALARYWKPVTWWGEHTALSTIPPSKPAPAFDACWGILVDPTRQESTSPAPLKSWTNGPSPQRPLNTSWNNWCLGHGCSERRGQKQEPSSGPLPLSWLTVLCWQPHAGFKPKKEPSVQGMFLLLCNAVYILGKVLLLLLKEIISVESLSRNLISINPESLQQC